MKQKFCYIVDKNGNPLAPTRKWDMIRRKLKNGTAKIIRRKPFVVKLFDKEVPKDKVTTCALCIDPGKTTGLAVVKNDTNEVVFQAESLIEAHKIKEKMQRRKQFKKQRKYYQKQKRIRRAKKAGTIFNNTKEFKYPKMKTGIKCKYIRPKSPRYLNRKKNHKYSPTVQYFLQILLRTINDIRKYLPINKILMEFVPFDIRKLQEPWIKGFWYQISNKKGFNNWSEYVKYRDKYQCILCKSKDNLHVHHIIPRSKGGKDNPKNLVTLCEKCHQKIHKLNEKDFNKYARKFRKYIDKVEKKKLKDEDIRYASYMNQVLKDLVLHLKDIEIIFTNPENTIKNRNKLGLDKTHVNDAISIYGDNIKYVNDVIFKIKHLNRHPLRLCTMGIEDRSYCYKPKTHKSKPIAFNRKPRIGQTKPSLQDLVNKYSKNITGKLTIYKKGHVRYRDKNQKYMQGDVIVYLDEKGNEKTDIVWLVRNKVKKIKLLNSGKEISFKNVVRKLYRKVVIYT